MVELIADHDLMRTAYRHAALVLIGDALAALKNASLPSDMIGPIADALALLAPHTYRPAH